MEEYQIWSLYNSARIGNSLSIIATILFVWLALRTAVQTRTPTSGEDAKYYRQSSVYRLLRHRCFLHL